MTRHLPGDARCRYSLLEIFSLYPQRLFHLAQKLHEPCLVRNQVR